MSQASVNVPKHVALILDGNRRFAKRLAKQPWRGHELGAGKIHDLLKYFKSYGVTQLTLYALSVDNINSRPKTELEMLFKIFRKELRELDIRELKDEGIRIRFIGNLSLLPKDVASQCEELEHSTRNNKPFLVNFAIAYGGREELVSAVKKILSNKVKPSDVDEELISNNLYMPDSPDLVIRTGGEKRTSNFLPWQSTYSEWIFLDKMWPEFSELDLKSCINEFSRRKRNFGK
jgi:tritrans,polycis-undecaprenyl-diphosphate synthase [geranylgeranyl-diphosphate specific]